MFLPCACDSKLHQGCDFVFFHPQDIKKGERLASRIGLASPIDLQRNPPVVGKFDGFILAYKLCEACKWRCVSFEVETEF